MPKAKKVLWMIVGALVLVAAGMAPQSFAAGDRVVAHLDTPFVINGESFDSGTISLREIEDFTPVSTLNEVYVDGRCLGIVMALVREGEAVSTRDELHFIRNADGSLVLEGISRRGEPARDLYQYREDTAGGHWYEPAATLLAANRSDR
ncbi:MAG: hypothetical protein GY716_20700 [bacterium]|nr:hypothetical protein [bacterium]